METSSGEIQSTNIAVGNKSQDLNRLEKDPTKWSTAVEPILSEYVKIHPACLEFATANISPTYPASLRTLAPEHFVVGTYQLSEDVQGNEQQKPSEDGHQERIGGLSLFRLSEGKLFWQQDLFRDYGVYDIKFLPYHPTFAAATTVGRIVIFNLVETSSHKLEIREVANHLVFPDEIIIISIAWLPLVDSQDQILSLAVTVENGGVYLISFNDGFESFIISNDEEPLHEHVYKTPYFENKERVWSCAFSSPTPDTIFSGGDDNYLRISTLTSARPHFEDGSINLIERFPAGVTSILPLPITNSIDKSHTFLIGCYDSYLRLCNIINPSSVSPEVKYLVDLDLNGGVYRLKFLEPYDGVTDPEEASFRILACCMHAGTKILQVRNSVSGEWSIEILAEVRNNESMCYAADVQPIPTWELGKGSPNDLGLERTCVSSSWADSKLSVWTFKPKEVTRS